MTGVVGDFHRPHITIIIIHKPEFVKYERKFIMITKAMIIENSVSTFGRGFISEVNGDVISVQQCNTSIRYYKLKINGNVVASRCNYDTALNKACDCLNMK